MNIEIVKTEEKDDCNEHIYRIVIDGKMDKDSSVSNNNIYVHSDETYQALKKFTCTSIPKLIRSFYYSIDVDWCEFPISIEVHISKKKLNTVNYVLNNEFISEEKEIEPHIILYPIIDLYQWNKTFSISVLSKFYKEVALTIDEVYYYESEPYPYDDNYGLKVPIKDKSVPLEETLEFAISSLKKVHSLSIDLLNSQNFSEGITTIFEFPSEVKTSCIQYLMYFGQFLEDLGIQADTSLSEKANRVLFTVTPQDRNQALCTIYEALSTYLNAPTEKINSNDNQNDIAIYQWKANIHHLQSQLELAKAMMQAKDATIEALKFSNYQLQTIVLSKNQLIHNPDTESKPEQILGGVVSIKKYEGKGFSIDLAEIFRRLKRKLQ